jgi:hypothetical protein
MLATVCFELITMPDVGRLAPRVYQSRGLFGTGAMR